MPCWEVRQVSVEISAADLELLADSIEKEYGVKVERLNGGKALRFVHPDGYLVTVAGGKVTVPAGREAEVNRIKRAYSKEAVKRDCKKFGWQVTEQDGGRRLVAARRG
jgi:hypothetical protein